MSAVAQFRLMVETWAYLTNIVYFFITGQHKMGHTKNITNAMDKNVSHTQMSFPGLRRYFFVDVKTFFFRRQYLKIISSYKLFDADWYLDRYPETRGFKGGPLNHFIKFGAFQDKAPHPLFDLKWYRNFYKLGRYVNPFFHFISNSKSLCYNPNPFLNTEWYAENYIRESSPKSFEVLKHYSDQGEKLHYLPGENFDPQFYAWAYPEARKFEYGLLAHYIHKGRVNKCLPFKLNSNFHSLCTSLHQVNLEHIEIDDVLSEHFQTGEEIEEFFLSCSKLPQDVPLRFNPDNYARYNSDLTIFENRPVAAIWHFLTHGIEENRFYKDSYKEEYIDNFYRIRNISKEEILDYKPTLKSCVLVHIFYPDLYEELKSYIKNLGELLYDIYINLVENDWTLDLQRRILIDFPDAKVIISQNIGRDIGGFFNLLSYVKDISTYNAFVLVHSKKSPHIPESLSTKWRKDLLEAILGSREIVLQNAYLMEKYNTTGFIGAGQWRHKSIDKNSEKYNALMRILEISPANQHCDYVSGTMMWLNSKVVHYLFFSCKKLTFEDGNNKSLEFHMDGQLAHSIERAIGNICKQLSLKTIFR